MNLRTKKNSAILISRQGLHPCLSTPWITQTQRAIQWVKSNDFRLYTSLGQNTWELCVFLAQKEGLDQVIVIPSKNPDDFENQKNYIIKQFCLDLNRVSFEAVYTEDPKTLRYQRDAKIVSSSDKLIPIAVRKKGHMEKLITQKKQQNPNCLIQDFQIKYQKNKTPIGYHIDQSRLSHHIYQLSSEYLIHWTRASNGPWPTEIKYEYFNAILKNDTYPRNALDTLKNILDLSQIKASTRHMPQKTPTVSFSGLLPHEAIPLMRWRARFCQMSFEPYGIGIEKSYAQSMGIQAVKYYKLNSHPKGVAPWLCQSTGRQGDWQLEKEYRFLGDIDLFKIPNDKLVCFCLKQDEAIKLHKKYKIKAIAMID
ncbi:hypothetical protein MHK_010318 [Candidatus Magnetomorum sp. HK-1]|nr:hypothetical protein MHK_010318 [Candidatus Magnetomorum sp. HK-1]